MISWRTSRTRVSASRRVVVDSWPSHDAVGGFFFEFEAVRTELTEMLRAGEATGLTPSGGRPGGAALRRRAADGGGEAAARAVEEDPGDGSGAASSVSRRRRGGRDAAAASATHVVAVTACGVGLRLAPTASRGYGVTAVRERLTAPQTRRPRTATASRNLMMGIECRTPTKIGPRNSRWPKRASRP